MPNGLFITFAVWVTTVADLIRMLQEHKVGHLYLFNPQKRKFLGVKIDENTTEITPQSFFWRSFKSLWRSLKITDIAKKTTHRYLSRAFGRNSQRYRSAFADGSNYSRPYFYALPPMVFVFR